MSDPDIDLRLPRPYQLLETGEKHEKVAAFWRRLLRATAARISVALNAGHQLRRSAAVRRDADANAMDGRIRAEQIDLAMRLAPLGALCYLSVVLVVAVALWRSASHGYL